MGSVNDMSAAEPPQWTFTRAVAKPRLEERVRERGREADTRCPE